MILQELVGQRPVADVIVALPLDAEFAGKIGKAREGEPTVGTVGVDDGLVNSLLVERVIARDGQGAGLDAQV